MNYSCFFCGRSTRENGDVCATCDRKISSPTAGILRTRPNQPVSLATDRWMARRDGDGILPGRQRRTDAPLAY